MQNRVRLTRRVAFSSGHRYWFADRSAEENRKLFGQWASPYNHGHNYLLSVACEGVLDPVTGMVVNIKLIDDALRQTVVADFDQKSINDEIPWFRDRAPTVENLLVYFYERLSSGDHPEECRLVALQLEEMPGFWGELAATKPMKLTLTRTYEFAASHRLHVPALSDAANLDLFGKCNNPAGHGHHYTVEITIEGAPDPTTGMIADLGEVDRLVEELVVDRYDHKNLNEDLPEFEGRPTTSEMVAREIFERLDGRLPAKLSRIRLHETARSVFEVAA